MSTAECVPRVIVLLGRTPGDDLFASFFVAVHDSSLRQLRYTNAGHLPSVCICGDSALYLDKGGMVLGVFEDYVYEEGTETVPPNAILVGYSDGLVEPENVYGEEFGITRLRDAAIRLGGSPPKVVAQGMMQAADEWAGTPDHAADMPIVLPPLQSNALSLPRRPAYTT